MKATSFFTVFVIFATLTFSGCTNDRFDNELSKGDINASKIIEILSKSTIDHVEIYEYNASTGVWDLAADNQNYSGGMDLCHVEGTYLYLDGGGSKSYPISNVPTHQLSGKYYFNLEYLVSIDLDKNASSEDNEMYLYFKY